MKKLRNIVALFVLTLLLTGCVKFNVNMDIKKDKSMDFSVVYAVDTSLLGGQEIMSSDDKKELEKDGFKVETYSKDKMKGVTLTKNIKNIDEVSSTDKVEYSVTKLTENKDDKMFTVKKGLFKNTYIAKIKFDSNDSGLNGLNDLTDEEEEDEDETTELETDDKTTDVTTEDDKTTDVTTEDDKTTDVTTEDDKTTTKEEKEEEKDDNPFSSLDYSSLMGNMDLSFNVQLPYSAKSSNATTKENDNKKLSWALTSTGDSIIEFEFELYNMTTIYICGGAGLLLLIIIIFIIAKCSKKKKNNINNVVEEVKVETPVDNVVEEINVPTDTVSVSDNTDENTEVNTEESKDTDTDQNTEVETQETI